MLDALEYMHEEVSVCHRDLKLENILIDSQLTFKVIDLGLSAAGDLHRVTVVYDCACPRSSFRLLYGAAF